MTSFPRYDPYNYTDGRWLHRDELQRNARRVMFDFSALCDRVIRLCPAAARVAHCEKKEGRCNRVFLLTMNTGSCVVARLPTGIAGPPRLTTNSEVATMTYLRGKISLPIPHVLDWSDDPSNPIGAEYIIQEPAVGVPLRDMWPRMNMEQHMLCTKALCIAITELASFNFPAYGSLYFADGPLESHLKIPFHQGEGFCIGPHCSPVFWNRSPGELELYGRPSPNCGPWKDLKSYSLGLIETGFSRLPNPDTVNHDLLPYQGSIQDHVVLISKSWEVMQQLIKNKCVQDAAAPTLLHPDFHKRNIYVSEENPTVITGVIDWQWASIEPAFVYANEAPDFANQPQETVETILGLDVQEIPGRSEKELKDASIRCQTYDLYMKAYARKIQYARALDPTLFHLFQCCHTSWRDSATALRHALVELSAYWTEELGLPGSCPYYPTDDELEQHIRDYDDFKAVQQLKQWLTVSLDSGSDGWVPNERWDATKDAHRAQYDLWMETGRDSELRGDDDMTVEKGDKLWPFDAR
ncbi:kinase-like domain-containing protein [Aspergillus taichungensis]|uniref:Altered inheritance of mitochondria protein 9, mitochondrial n=1 Tax=Aspergillus taichungensis TaxID=482145 RepID=A0A2J5HH38_9EURO|nr:kinase-like domain-containing protein [Aspergillus taichungensis]